MDLEGDFSILAFPGHSIDDARPERQRTFICNHAARELKDCAHDGVVFRMNRGRPWLFD